MKKFRNFEVTANKGKSRIEICFCPPPSPSPPPLFLLISSSLTNAVYFNVARKASVIKVQDEGEDLPKFALVFGQVSRREKAKDDAIKKKKKNQIPDHRPRTLHSIETSSTAIRE